MTMVFWMPNIIFFILIYDNMAAKYYYKENNGNYDIYYGQYPTWNYKEFKPPKSYKSSYHDRGDRPGKCILGDFRCTSPYPVSQTKSFECELDYQCPRYFKCCRNRCFKHKICQPIDMEEADNIEMSTSTTWSTTTQISTTPDTTSIPISSTESTPQKTTKWTLTSTTPENTEISTSAIWSTTILLSTAPVVTSRPNSTKTTSQETTRPTLMSTTIESTENYTSTTWSTITQQPTPPKITSIPNRTETASQNTTPQTLISPTTEGIEHFISTTWSTTTQPSTAPETTFKPNNTETTTQNTTQWTLMSTTTEYDEKSPSTVLSKSTAIPIHETTVITTAITAEYHSSSSASTHSTTSKTVKPESQSTTTGLNEKPTTNNNKYTTENDTTSVVTNTPTDAPTTQFTRDEPTTTSINTANSQTSLTTDQENETSSDITLIQTETTVLPKINYTNSTIEQQTQTTTPIGTPDVQKELLTTNKISETTDRTTSTESDTFPHSYSTLAPTPFTTSSTFGRTATNKATVPTFVVPTTHIPHSATTNRENDNSIEQSTLSSSSITTKETTPSSVIPTKSSLSYSSVTQSSTGSKFTSPIYDTSSIKSSQDIETISVEVSTDFVNVSSTVRETTNENTNFSTQTTKFYTASKPSTIRIPHFTDKEKNDTGEDLIKLSTLPAFSTYTRDKSSSMTQSSTSRKTELLTTQNLKYTTLSLVNSNPETSSSTKVTILTPTTIEPTTIKINVTSPINIKTTKPHSTIKYVTTELTPIPVTSPKPIESSTSTPATQLSSLSTAEKQRTQIIDITSDDEDLVFSGDSELATTTSDLNLSTNFHKSSTALSTISIDTSKQNQPTLKVNTDIPSFTTRASNKVSSIELEETTLKVNKESTNDPDSTTPSFTTSTHVSKNMNPTSATISLYKSTLKVNGDTKSSTKNPLDKVSSTTSNKTTSITTPFISDDEDLVFSGDGDDNNIETTTGYQTSTLSFVNNQNFDDDFEILPSVYKEDNDKEFAVIKENNNKEIEVENFIAAIDVKDSESNIGEGSRREKLIIEVEN